MAGIADLTAAEAADRLDRTADDLRMLAGDVRAGRMTPRQWQATADLLAALRRVCLRQIPTWMTAVRGVRVHLPTQPDRRRISGDLRVDR